MEMHCTSLYASRRRYVPIVMCPLFFIYLSGHCYSSPLFSPNKLLSTPTRFNFQYIILILQAFNFQVICMLWCFQSLCLHNFFASHPHSCGMLFTVYNAFVLCMLQCKSKWGRFAQVSFFFANNACVTMFQQPLLCEWSLFLIVTQLRASFGRWRWRWRCYLYFDSSFKEVFWCHFSCTPLNSLWWCRLPGPFWLLIAMLYNLFHGSGGSWSIVWWQLGCQETYEYVSHWW